MKKIVKWVGIPVAGLIAVGALASGGEEGEDPVASQPTAVSDPTTAPEPEPEETAAPEPTTTEPEETTEAAEPEEEFSLAQSQALISAQNYVDIMAFSKAGLLGQLTSEYGEGFDLADAEWAVERVVVDWDAEAVEAARNYLDLGMGFSRQSLIEQLTSEYGEQFTLEQATQAVDEVGL